MTKLKTLLMSYADVELAALGGRPTTPMVPQRLGNELKNIINQNKRFFWICVFMTIGLFGAHIWVVLTYAGNLTLVGAASGVFGLSAAALISQMINLWREAVATELLLNLLPVLDGQVVKTIINALVKRLR